MTTLPTVSAPEAETLDYPIDRSRKGSLSRRAVATIALAALILLVTRRTGGVRRRDLPMLTTIGVFDAGANVLFGVATTLGLLSVTSVLGSLYPVVTAILAAVLLKERLRPVQYAGVAFAMAGVILLGLSA